MSSAFYTNLIFRILLTLVFFVSVSTVLTGRRLLFYGLGVVVAIMILEWISFYFKDEFTLMITASVLYLLFFVFVIYRLFLVITRSKRVTIDVISVAICVYLIIGILFSILCSILNRIYEGAYSDVSETGTRIYEFIYYTFITLATVGYGDITPQIPQTEALAVLIGIAGQLYMTIIVAILVGKFLMHTSEEKH
jgi:hypothetical protein